MIFFKKHCHKRVFPDFIHKTRKKEKKAFKHESVLHSVIPVQPRNLVKKRNLAHFESILWPLNDAASEKRECVGPGLSLACPMRHQKSPILAASGWGSASFLCFSWWESKTTISKSSNILCIIHRINNAWIKPVADSCLAGKGSCSIQPQLYQPTQLLYKNICHICMCVRAKHAGLLSQLRVMITGFPVRQRDSAHSCWKSP